MMMADFAIETCGLEKIYRSQWHGREIKAVSNLSLRVPAGVKYGLLGANGAGKTTVVKKLLKAGQPNSGSATLFCRDARPAEGRPAGGYLPEDQPLPTYL